jgi:hypothetical protein
MIAKVTAVDTSSPVTDARVKVAAINGEVSTAVTFAIKGHPRQLVGVVAWWCGVVERPRYSQRAL